jgi:membrane-associated phospholipid phosphatase
MGHDAGFRAVNDFARSTPLLHAAMVDFAKYGVVLFGALLLLNWWWARACGNRIMAQALWAPAGVLLAVALNQPIVNLVREARPYDTLPHILVLVDRSTDYSFPSDHAVMAGAVATGIVLTHRRLGALVVGSALLMAFARVYVGAHFPLDVLAGLAFGATVTVVAGSLTCPVLRRVVAWLARTRLHALVIRGPVSS